MLEKNPKQEKRDPQEVTPPRFFHLEIDEDWVVNEVLAFLRTHPLGKYQIQVHARNDGGEPVTWMSATFFDDEDAELFKKNFGMSDAGHYAVAQQILRDLRARLDHGRHP
ncbi:hypothetical protein [Azospirillum sp. sgz301742]